LATDCISCHVYAYLMGASPNACACSPGFYGSPNSSNCIACHSTCGTCADGPASQCMSCKNYAILATVAPSNCVCMSGFTPTPDASSCLVVGCHGDCRTCSGDTSVQCLTCHPNASPIASVPAGCECNVGFYSSSGASLCLLCHPSCRT
jgi:hypothetical protein